MLHYKWKYECKIYRSHSIKNNKWESASFVPILQDKLFRKLFQPLDELCSSEMKKHKEGWSRGPVRKFFLAAFSHTLFDPEAAFFTVGPKLLVNINEFHC
jgi:hypothetical protein